jgi:hypothetical protein
MHDSNSFQIRAQPALSSILDPQIQAKPSTFHVYLILNRLNVEKTAFKRALIYVFLSSYSFNRQS